VELLAFLAPGNQTEAVNYKHQEPPTHPLQMRQKNVRSLSVSCILAEPGPTIGQDRHLWSFDLAFVSALVASATDQPG
jgi:hypothetical protein